MTQPSSDGSYPSQAPGAAWTPPLAPTTADLSPLPTNGHRGPSADAIAHLHDGLGEGRPWSSVLVEAVGLWTAPEEHYRGGHYVYLLEGEAFDWLLLAERLLREVPDAAPEEAKADLLFYGNLPSPVTPSLFQEALGETKYRAHLNFFYGVVVEEALTLAVEEEVLKERGVRGLSYPHGVEDTVMQRLYGETTPTLLRRFYQAHAQRRRQSLSLSEWKAFTYWLFKLRVERSDQSRMASDTRKGLRRLQALVPARHDWAALPMPY